MSPNYNHEIFSCIGENIQDKDLKTRLVIQPIESTKSVLKIKILRSKYKTNGNNRGRILSRRETPYAIV